MPRDYSRNRNDRSSDRRDPRRGSSQSASGITWLLIGVLIGLCVAGVAYLNQSKNHNINEANVNSPQMAMNQATNTAANTAKKTNANSPQFDFYNMLPANQTATPTATEADNAQTTTDSIAPNSSPPNPAKVNAILSGVTPPSANANNANVANANTDNTNNNTNQNNGTNLASNSNQNNVNSQNNAQQLSANSVNDNGDVVSVPKNATNTNAVNSTLANNRQVDTTAKGNSLSPSQYVIQLAAFTHYQQADQFKAQLAFYGYEAKIISFQKNGRTLQRVWLGPFPSLTAAAAVQRQLASNQIKSTLLRSDIQ